MSDKQKANADNGSNGVGLNAINHAGVVNPDSYKFYAEWTKANPPRKSKL